MTHQKRVIEDEIIKTAIRKKQRLVPTPIKIGDLRNHQIKVEINPRGSIRRRQTAKTRLLESQTIIEEKNRQMGIPLQKITKLLVLACLTIVFVACNDNSVFFEYQSLANQKWKNKEPVVFDFKISDTISKNNLFINIRNTNEYSFSNLYIISELYFPNGKKMIDTLHYQMADDKGRFLGKGFSEIKENKLFYKQGIQFPNSGNHQLAIYQAMRRNGEENGIENLEGILDVGLKIEKIEK